jgi:putative endonuclease
MRMGAASGSTGRCFIRWAAARELPAPLGLEEEVIAVPAKAGTHLRACAMFFTYLLANRPHGTLYIGSTSDLIRRVWEHKVKAVPGFTAKYGVDRLVWFELHDTLAAAMLREKRIKSWKRVWKIELIEKGQSALDRPLLALNGLSIRRS